MCHSDPAKNASPTPVIPAKNPSCFAATVTPYMDLLTTFATTAAHMGVVTARSCAMTAGSRVNAPPARMHVTPHAMAANVPAARPTSRSNVAIFPAATRLGTSGRRYFGMNAWPAWMSGSPQSTATAKMFPAMRCAAETTTPRELAKRISAV